MNNTQMHRSLDADIAGPLLDRWETATAVEDEGKTEAALAEYLACWESLPEPREAWVLGDEDFPISAVIVESIACAFVSLGDTEQALEWARLSCEMSPEEGSARVLLGLTQLDAGERELALESFRSAYRSEKYRAFRDHPPRCWEFFKRNR